MSKQRYRKFTPEFKREAVRLAESTEGPITQVARELGLRVNLIYKWRRQILQHGSEAFPGSGYRVYYMRRDMIVYLLLIGGSKATQQRDIKQAKAMAEKLERG